MTETNERPIRLLVIQLARLGDTLQSLMALRAAKQLYPQLEIHFVARERFAGGVKRVPWIENVITLPTDSLLSPIFTGEKSQSQVLSDLARWISPLVSEPWDMVVNWSYSESSSFLTALMPARIKLGYSRRKDTSFACLDGWSNYIQGVIQGGVDQNIHLTDVLTTQLLTALQIHVGEPSDNGDSPVTSKSFFSLELGESDPDSWKKHSDLTKKWIAIQLGAGQDEKTWDPENWCKLADYILSRHRDHNIVLLGGNEDLERARRFQAELRARKHDARSIVSLVGQTDFDLWASVVSRCNWMFAGDTAAIHLASVLGTRVMNISVGPVRWAETGPYGNGHYVVTSAKPCAGCASKGSTDSHTCRQDVTPESVYAAWSYALSEFSNRKHGSLERHFNHLGWAELASSVRIFRSKIRSTMDGGGVVYEPLLHAGLNFQDWTAKVMGHIARAWYCGWVPPVGQEVGRMSINPSLIQKLRELDESAGVLSKVCDEAIRTATVLNRKSSRLKSDKVMRLRDRDELRELGKKLLELDALTERLGKTSPPLLGFSQMLKVLMHNLKSTQLADLGKESADCYKQLLDGVAILRDWIKHTLELAKPMAVRSEPLQLVSKGRNEITP